MFRTIVLTVVDTPEGRRAIQMAEHLAREMHATLHLALILPPQGISQGLASYAAPEMARLLEDDRLHALDTEEQQIESARDLQGLVVRAHRVDTDYVESVLDIVRDVRADLLVVGLKRSDALISRLWNKVDQLAHETPCCILAVP